MTTRRATAAAALTAALTVLAVPTATAAGTPDAAVGAPATLDTLSRFFARDGAAVTRDAGRPRVEGRAVPVRVLSPDFVAGRAGAPVARVEFHASRAVSSDGRKASVWTARRGADGWRVVNIATGDDEIRYAEEGARRLPGGTVFREPQIDAWYVHRGTRVLPLDEDAVRAVGAGGTTLAAYRDRVAAAYGDKLPGSAYARRGAAGGYGAPAGPAPVTPGGPSAAAGPAQPPAGAAAPPSGTSPGAAASTASTGPAASTASAAAAVTAALAASALVLTGALRALRTRRRRD
ncbi:hypothetical protein ACPCAC_30350 [Streptomyces lavendulocolor]|uniref:hypothetical protein n=1 Tax=Streptomyces lavendulocolor TaxID=67316 RepID=UPI003C2CFE26